MNKDELKKTKSKREIIQKKEGRKKEIDLGKSTVLRDEEDNEQFDNPQP